MTVQSPARLTASPQRSGDVPIFINGRFVAQPLSGVQRFATEITRALLERAPEAVTILTPPTGRPAMAGACAVGRGGGQVWEQLQLPGHARGGVLVNLGNTAPVLARRQVVVIHDAGVFRTPESYPAGFRLWYRVLHNVLARSGARIVAVSEFTRQELVRSLRIPLRRVAVISEGADHIGRLAADEAALGAAGLVPGRYVLAVGNLAAHKNLGALSPLSAALAARDMPLVITGGLDRSAFAAPAACGLPHEARYIGRVSDEALKALYAHAACFVFPSRYEGFGLPAVEAMFCGCPVVAADVPGLRETCGDAVLYCDPSAPADIMAKVLRTTGDQALAARLREAGLRRAARYRWADAADALLGVISACGQ